MKNKQLMEAMESLLEKGLMEIVGYDESGEPFYALTELGIDVAGEMAGTNDTVH